MKNKGNQWLFKPVFDLQKKKITQPFWLYSATPTKSYFKNLSVQPAAASAVCRMFMFRTIGSQFLPFNPPNTHFHSFSLTSIYYLRPRTESEARLLKWLLSSTGEPNGCPLFVCSILVAILQKCVESPHANYRLKTNDTLCFAVAVFAFKTTHRC